MSAVTLWIQLRAFVPEHIRIAPEQEAKIALKVATVNKEEKNKDLQE
jgi:hypothetical protein